MMHYDSICDILNMASKIDKHFKLFGASSHKYKLNSVISESFINEIEKKYNFRLPEEYAYYITKIGDGGACVDYGIEPFSKFMESTQNADAEEYNEAYRKSISEPLCLRKMMPDEVDSFAFAKAAYEESPEKFFVSEISDEDISETKGFLILGTHGCQWDYGIVVTGEYHGKIFDIDNQGGFLLVANSFDEFYQNWLESIEKSKLKKKLKEQKKRYR